jgi:hypothetical protein
MQKHLCRTLAHYTIFLGSKLGLPIPSNMERFILDAAHLMWNKEGCFVWAIIDKDHTAEDPEEQVDSIIDDEYFRTNVDNWAFHLSEYYSTQGYPDSQDPNQFRADFDSSSAFDYPYGFSCGSFAKAGVTNAQCWPAWNGGNWNALRDEALQPQVFAACMNPTYDHSFMSKLIAGLQNLLLV